MYYPRQEEFVKEFNLTTPMLIGSGTFGKVFKMECIGGLEKKMYAVKYIEVQTQETFIKIQNEFIINRMIDTYKNVIKVHKVYAWQEMMPPKFVLILVMQLADHSLTQEIQIRKQEMRHFSVNQLFDIFRKCLTAFSTLQKSKGIYHRDIKPDNILFCHGEPMVTDFGVSKTLNEQKIKESLKNTLVGTPIYLSPILWEAYVVKSQTNEKIKHNLEKSDIFSLGLSFLQCALLLTNEIIGLNQVLQLISKKQGQVNKEILLARIENAKIRQLISSMLQYQESDRGSYDELLQIIQSPQKGIFQVENQVTVNFNKLTGSQKTVN